MTFEQSDRLKLYEEIAKKRQNNLILVLEDLYDPHNAAAIFRSADAFGIQTIYLIFDKQAPFDPLSLAFKRSSAFTNKWLDFRIFNSTEECFKALKQANFNIVATILNKSAKSIYETDFQTSKKLALVMGNEHSGISKTAENLADQTIYIPMQGFAESFNLSVATAISLSEITRQRSSEQFLNNPEQTKNLIKNFQQKQANKKAERRARKKFAQNRYQKKHQS
jgi:tRNA (guanosine-2'-O-)-methyltransferase